MIYFNGPHYFKSKITYVENGEQKEIEILTESNNIARVHDIFIRFFESDKQDPDNQCRVLKIEISNNVLPLLIN